MSNNPNNETPRPIRPVPPSEPPGTPLRKAPEGPVISPVEPSERPGTSIPLSEPLTEDYLNISTRCVSDRRNPVFMEDGES